MADEEFPPFIGDRPCGLYLPGHQVHFIQARKAAADPGVPVELVDASDSMLIFATRDGLATYRNHHATRVLVFIRKFGEAVLVERWGVLRVGRGQLFSLSSADAEIPACPPPPD